MRVIVTADVAEAAARAAEEMAEAIRAAVAARGRAIVALSGGRSPQPMFERLASLDLPWPAVHVAQVDERVVPRGDARRNLLLIESTLVTHGPLPADHLHPMPVEAHDLEAAATEYAQALMRLAADTGRLDAVQLGLGADGHTASLVPDDPALGITDRDVAVSGPYQGVRRMTLTFPTLNRAERLVWFVVGEDRARAARELAEGVGSSPAARVARDRAVLVADRAAGGALSRPPASA